MSIHESAVKRWSIIIVSISCLFFVGIVGAFFALKPPVHEVAEVAEDCESGFSGEGCKTVDPYRFKGERRLRNIQMLTNAGENAEAYFSLNGKYLTYQSHVNTELCDQIYLMKTDGSNKRLVSTGKGSTTCAYMFSDRTVIYASTHLHLNGSCPPRPDKSKGYVWKLYDEYDIFSVDLQDPTNLRRLTDSSTYDAEATISPLGDKVVFTSLRTGDPELYTMNIDGSEQTQITNVTGYDGGAFFSWDGKQIVFRASRPKTAKELEDYEELVRDRLVRPTTLELFVMKSDGSDMKQVTHLNSASFAPFFHPDNTQIAFCSNIDSARNFDIYLTDTNAASVHRITNYTGFDGFPMWSKDGKKFVFASNRFNAAPGDTNVFIADWVDE